MKAACLTTHIPWTFQAASRKCGALKVLPNQTATIDVLQCYNRLLQTHTAAVHVGAAPCCCCGLPGRSRGVKLETLLDTHLKVCCQ